MYASVRATGEGLSVNLAGREAKGIVSTVDYERVRAQAEGTILSYVDPETGKSPVARVLRREDVFHGTFEQLAPDLLLEPETYYGLTGGRSIVEAAGWMSGGHRMEGVLVAAGPEVNQLDFPRSARLVDLAPTILAALDASTSAQHDGQVIRSIVNRSLQRSLVRDQDSESGQIELSRAEADEVEEHLRGLGYLE
jgi:predicted AlkP superfamily phosphohydrolase/phosphomutase